MELVFCVKEDARAVLVLYKYCSYFCGFVEICFNLVCMWRPSVYCREKPRFKWVSGDYRRI